MLLGNVDKNPADHQSHHEDEDKKQQDPHHYQHRVGVTGTECTEDGQHHNTNNIVDQGGAEQSGARFGFQLPHLVQGLHRDGY